MDALLQEGRDEIKILDNTSYLSFALIMKISMIFGEKRQENSVNVLRIRCERSEAAGLHR
jgi:hypothetical protein